MSSNGKQRSSLGGVGTSCAAERGTDLGHAPGHNQSSNTGTQPQDSEWCRHVRLSATRLQRYDALKSVRKEKCRGKGEEKSKRKGKEKGKSKDKSKEGTSDTSNTRCSLCKGKDCLKSLTWPAEKKTMSYELCKLTMIDSDACAHPKHGQGDGIRKLSETRPLPGAEMQQRGMRQMSHDTEVGRVTAVYRALDMSRNGDKSAVAMLKKNEHHHRTGRLVKNAYLSNTRQLGCVFQDMEPPKSSSILRKSSNIVKPIRCVRFTKAVLRHANISRPESFARNDLPR